MIGGVTRRMSPILSGVPHLHVTGPKSTILKILIITELKVDPIRSVNEIFTTIAFRISGMEMLFILLAI